MKEKSIILKSEEIKKLKSEGRATIKIEIKHQPKIINAQNDFKFLNISGKGPLWDFNPYKPGTKLWVKETWAKIYDDEPPCCALIDRCTDCSLDKHPFHFEYRADTGNPLPGDWPIEEKDIAPKWRSSVLMPREASRFNVIVESVKVQEQNGVYFWVVELKKNRGDER